MNFEFSDDSLMLRDQARNFLRSRCDPQLVRDVMTGEAGYAKELWREMAGMGWLGAAIPEAYGGAGLGYEILCVLAEEMGRVLAPVPFGSSIYLAAEALIAAADEAQKSNLLPDIASGSRIAAFAFAEGLGRTGPATIALRATADRLSGTKWPVVDGMIADALIVVARDEQGIGLYHVDPSQPGVTRRPVDSFDPSRGQSLIRFDDVPADRLGAADDHWPIVAQVLDHAAILTAFEQVGGAEACLTMARDYAMNRIAFGRPLASFQAIKHKLADVFVELEIARGNAYYGAWTLDTGASELPLAAATARVSAIEAFRVAAKENIQTHGGAGFTWEFDCHLYYRRAKYLALSIGAAPYWMDLLVDRIQAARSAAEGQDGF